VGDQTEFFYYSNRGDEIQKIKPGIYGLSNHLLDTPWPKTAKGKGALERLLGSNEKINAEEIFSLLVDGAVPPDELLPDTGVDLDWERTLSPLFITSEIYGTRSSSIVLIQRGGETTFMERTFIPDGGLSKAEKTRKISFMIQGAGQDGSGS